jgi:hypothetical protein
MLKSDNENQLSYRQITQLEDTYDLPNITYDELNDGILLKDIQDGIYDIEYCFGGWKTCRVTILQGKIPYVEFFDEWGGTNKIHYNEVHPFYQGFIFGKFIEKLL